ncbi:MAG: DUF445 domain-containing protein, partial [Alphaproteobacteria bacterium]|nr:DUF445 domain-containing protein [Alphaproteobacteria bacterium]
MRLLATALLTAMIAVLIGARLGQTAFPEAQRWLGFVRAFAEAATVGACADWFAVTALFRHPLGLPIPHTAIVPRNKERIAAGLGSFLESNFLSPELVEQKLRSLAIADRGAAWLAHPANATFLAERVAAAIPASLRTIDDHEVGALVETVLLDQIRGVQAAPLAGRALSVLIANNHHQALFDALLDAAVRTLERNQDFVRDHIAQRSAWWIPRFLDEKIFDAIMGGLRTSLLGMRAPNNDWRTRFEAAMVELADKLQHAPDYVARGERLKEEFIASPLMRDYLASVWDETRTRVIADLERPNSLTKSWIAKVLETAGARLLADPAQRQVVDGWIVGIVLRQVVPHRREIGDFIAGVVRRWDTRTLVDKLEAQVGPDLQYIRISGTVVGGLVGL